MSRIFCIVGPSAVGKDTFYKELLLRYAGKLTPVVPSTTRPMREGEVDGVDYHFVTPERLAELEAAGRIIEKREYHTVRGLWSYFTMKFDLEEGRDYALISTPEGAEKLQAHYGAERVRVVYLRLDPRVRLLRGIEREARQATPNYAEVCRRFLADEHDFAPENVAKLCHVDYIDTDCTVAESLSQWDELFGNRA